ncbi:hypothetical protein NQZ68_035089 [Dissostichus eleginoides]|nr:hypothetical protein NQZ68_035089 [Dissostichus eleginoides]
MKRQKPSGAQYKNRRKEEEEKRAKVKDSLLKYLGPPAASVDKEQPCTSAVPASSDLEPHEGTSKQQAAHPDEMTNDSTLPLTTVPVCSGEYNMSIDAQNHCKERQNSLLHLILIAPQIPPIHSSQMQQRQTIHYQPILLTALHISQTQ